MAAKILLPDGTPATLIGRKWQCSDPDAIPVLEYFSSLVPREVYQNKEEVKARGVAEFLIGSQYLGCDSLRWVHPDIVV